MSTKISLLFLWCLKVKPPFPSHLVHGEDVALSQLRNSKHTNTWDLPLTWSKMNPQKSDKLRSWVFKTFWGFLIKLQNSTIFPGLEIPLPFSRFFRSNGKPVSSLMYEHVSTCGRLLFWSIRVKVLYLLARVHERPRKLVMKLLLFLLCRFYGHHLFKNPLLLLTFAFKIRDYLPKK